MPEEATGRIGEQIPLSAGRIAFGADPSAYQDARPPYPAEVSVWLRALPLPSCANFFEVGPGTGISTQLLLQLNPARLAAIEPDARMAAFLQQRFANEARLQLIQSTFEQAPLRENAYGLGAAATSFHWIEQAPALARIYSLLHPGGWWSMWWNVFGDRDHPDAFEQASTPLFRQLTPSPSPDSIPWTCDGRLPFALDDRARRAQLSAVGFEQIRFHRLDWTHRMNTAQVQSLAATFSQVSLATPERRAWFLDTLGELVERTFGGSVERHFSTVFYAARKPE
ncbi:MAG: class I SAM-dependent methyltransferase [Terracidiphilus sp.]|nr:class I SAM-dependent methyltransferase [Terracidiphilus sp.]